MHPDLIDQVENWKSLTVLVIGDVMLDCYLRGEADRLCQEAPVPVVAVTQRQDFPGGAANVAGNVVSLGGKVVLLSVVGADSEGDRLQHSLNQRGISTNALLACPQRATLAKQRVLAGSHLLVRFDQGSTEAIAPDLEQQLIARLIEQFPHCDAVIVSDYGYGILTPRVIETLAKLQTQQPRALIVDSKHLTAYQRVNPTAVKPNYSETIQLLSLSKQSDQRAEQITPYGDRLLNLTGARVVAVTLDTEGAIVFESGQTPYRTYTQSAPPHQTSGAGDTFISAFALALATGASATTAASLAAAATTIVVRQIGTASCTAQELCQLLSPAAPQQQAPSLLSPPAPCLPGTLPRTSSASG
jgi:D-beta-D-heptose 7-phosphate kinase/D-beta-D-heptose 1-phosphate adenosyltransferase